MISLKIVEWVSNSNQLTHRCCNGVRVVAVVKDILKLLTKNKAHEILSILSVKYQLKYTRVYVDAFEN